MLNARPLCDGFPISCLLTFSVTVKSSHNLREGSFEALLVTPSPVSPRPRHRYSYVLHPYKCFIVMSRQRCGGEAEEVNNGNLLQLMVGFKLYTPHSRPEGWGQWAVMLRTEGNNHIIPVTRPVEYEDGWHCVCMSHYLDSYLVKRTKGLPVNNKLCFNTSC